MVSARHVVLIGLMASGKSSVGPLLGVRLGRDFVDNDALLEERTGQSARQLASAEGVDALHRHEAEALVSALADPVPAVVAAAAAAPMETDVAAALHGHFVVYLRAVPAVLAKRRAGSAPGDDHRPAVGSIAEQFDARDARYRELATLVVDETGTAPDAVVAAITAALV
jgi:shikimate kinase